MAGGEDGHCRLRCPQGPLITVWLTVSWPARGWAVYGCAGLPNAQGTGAPGLGKPPLWGQSHSFHAIRAPGQGLFFPKQRGKWGDLARVGQGEFVPLERVVWEVSQHGGRSDTGGAW